MNPSRLLQNSRNLLSAQVIVVFCGILSTSILSHNLGIEGYGKFVLAVDICLTVAILVDFGLPTWGLRKWDGAPESAIPVMMRVMRIQVKIAILLISISILATSAFEIAGNILLFMILLLSVCIIVFTEPLRVGLRMIGYSKFEAISRSCEKLVITSGYLVLSLYGNLGLIEAAVSIFMGAVTTLIVTRVLVSRALFSEGISSEVEQEPDLPDIRTTIWQALPFAVAIAAYPLLGRIDKMLLGTIVDVGLVSVYNAAWVVLLTGFIVPNVIRQSISPLLAEANSSRLRVLHILSSKKIVYSLLGIGIPSSIIISEILLDVIFPTEFIEDRVFPELSGVKLFSLLLPTWVWSMLACTKFESLKYNRDRWALSTVVGLSLSINFVVGLALVSKWSIVGVAASSICAQFSIFFISSVLQIEEISFPPRLAIMEFLIGLLGTIGLILFATKGVFWDSTIPGDMVFLAGMYVLMIVIATSDDVVPSTDSDAIGI